MSWTFKPELHISTESSLQTEVFVIVNFFVCLWDFLLVLFCFLFPYFPFLPWAHKNNLRTTMTMEFSYMLSVHDTHSYLDNRYELSIKPSGLIHRGGAACICRLFQQWELQGWGQFPCPSRHIVCQLLFQTDFLRLLCQPTRVRSC